MICNNCRVLMRRVMRFEAGKAWKLKRCPKCFYETHPAPLYFDDFKETQQCSIQMLQKKNKHDGCARYHKNVKARKDDCN